MPGIQKNQVPCHAIISTIKIKAVFYIHSRPHQIPNFPVPQQVTTLDAQSGLRNITCPWTGYHNRNAVYYPLNNVRLIARMNKQGNSCGTITYSNRDRSCARTYDALSDYTRNFDGSGSNQDVTDRSPKLDRLTLCPL